MRNDDTQAAWNYHDATKHSQESIRRNRHYLDWENQPIPFKVYSELEPIALPQHLSSSGVAALDAIAVAAAPAHGETGPSLQTLAELLFLSAGVTKRKNYPGGEMWFRAAACTGALYHVDLYLVCGDLPELPAGVYHFSPHDFSLRRLREGDYREVLVRASGREPSLAAAPCAIVSASTFWRNAWKYQARAYRHCGWDNGTILANLLAAAAAHNLPAKIVGGFVDDAVSELLALDSRREAVLSLVTLGHAPARAVPSAPAVEPVKFAIAPLSGKEIEYPAMREMHQASALESEAEAAAWRTAQRQSENRRPASGSPGRVFPLAPVRQDELAPDSIEQVILRRGSTREFGRESITFAQLSTMLDRTTRGIPADFLESAATLNHMYLIVHAVDDLPPGAYYFRRDERALELLKEGDFRRQAGALGLGQDIPADASVNVYFLADLAEVLDRFGNRGYRAAELEAAIMGGKLYLAAYAQRLGASGLTFFDDDVTDFFSPHAAGKSVMFLIALGKSAKRKS